MGGVEPPTTALSERYSNQLSYISKIAGVDGFEPSNSGVKVRCVEPLHHAPKFRIRILVLCLQVIAILSCCMYPIYIKRSPHRIQPFYFGLEGLTNRSRGHLMPGKTGRKKKQVHSHTV